MHTRNQDAIASTTRTNCGQLIREADGGQAGLPGRPAMTPRAASVLDLCGIPDNEALSATHKIRPSTAGIVSASNSSSECLIGGWPLLTANSNATTASCIEST